MAKLSTRKDGFAAGYSFSSESSLLTNLVVISTLVIVLLQGRRVFRGSAFLAPLDEQALTEQLQKCDSFACLREVNEAAAGRTRFNFPHFLVVGWPKCATTSLHW